MTVYSNCVKCGKRLNDGQATLCSEHEQAMTPSEHTDAAWQLGHELMQPMPPGWFRTHHETISIGWQVTMVDHKNHMQSGWPERAKYEAQANNESLATAHELCREQAWQKHKKNTEVSNGTGK